MADALIVEEILILADQPDDSVLVNAQEVVEVVTAIEVDHQFSVSVPLPLDLDFRVERLLQPLLDLLVEPFLDEDLFELARVPFLFQPAQLDGQFALQVRCPGVQILTGVGVDGLIVTAVKLAVADHVADDAAAETAPHRTRRPDGDRPARRTLVDSRPGFGPVRLDMGAVDRQYRCHSPSLAAVLRSRRVAQDRPVFGIVIAQKGFVQAALAQTFGGKHLVAALTADGTIATIAEKYDLTDLLIQ